MNLAKDLGFITFSKKPLERKKIRKSSFCKSFFPEQSYKTTYAIKLRRAGGKYYSTRDNLESLVDILDWRRDLCGWEWVKRRIELYQCYFT